MPSCPNLVSPPRPRFYGRYDVPLPTGEEAARFDRWAMDEADVASSVLMENAGRSAALVLDRLHPEGPVVVAAGPGNNGGDGMVLARTLAAQGREVRVITVGSRPRPDSLLHGWVLPVDPLPDDEGRLSGLLADSAVVVDALLGTGARGEPRAPYAKAIGAINRARAPVIALGIPSGVDAGTGAVAGAAVEAEVTVAFGAPKLGTLLLPGRQRAGRVVAVEIGFPPMDPTLTGARLITPDWARARRPRRPLGAHKKAAGWVLVLAGSPGMAGAAVLAARGALRAGAGYVQVASPPENRSVLQAAVPEALFVDASDSEALTAAARSCDVLVAGPGMGTGDEAARRLDGLLALPESRGIVLDADALTLLGEGRLPAYPGSAVPLRRLLTPHPGEMARLGAEPDEIRAAPLEACRAGAEQWSTAVLLKGAPSVVGEPGGELAGGPPPRRAPVRVSATGSSDLARAGMGDVLAGAAGAFMARGSDGAEAAALALHFTGRAAALAGGGEALLPSHVADALGLALAEETPARSELDLPFVTLDLARPR